MDQKPDSCVGNIISVYICFNPDVSLVAGLENICLAGLIIMLRMVHDSDLDLALAKID